MGGGVGFQQGACRLDPAHHTGHAQVCHGKALRRQMVLAALGLALQVLLQHAQRHLQAPFGGVGQIGLALLGRHGQAVHEHGERVGLQLVHGPEAPAQCFGILVRVGRGQAAAIALAMVAREVQRAGHAFPQHHLALGAAVHQHRDVAIGVERQKLRRARAAFLIRRGHMLKRQPQFGSGPQRAHSARCGNAVNGQTHGKLSPQKMKSSAPATTG